MYKSSEQHQNCIDVQQTIESRDLSNFDWRVDPCLLVLLSHYKPQLGFYGSQALQSVKDPHSNYQ